MDRRTIFSTAEAVLAFSGTCVAGTLYWAHKSGIELPCTSGDGCDLVNASHWSHVDGIPVSLFGLAGYIVLLFAAVIKLTADDDGLSHRLLLLIVAITLFGTCYSWYLQYVADVFIGAFCIYCRSSAIIMSVLFLTSSTELAAVLIDRKSKIH